MATDAQGRQLSDDGYYYWDGSAWQLVDQGGASGDGAGDFKGAFAQAMTQAGFPIDASVLPDEAALEAGLNAAVQWYDSLDQATKDGIDAATNDPGQAAIALAEAGVATGIDSLLQAFDQVQGKLGDLLQAAQHAETSAKQTSH